MNGSKYTACGAFLAFAFASPSYVDGQNSNSLSGPMGISHVLLLSVDGMHAVDLINCSQGIPDANGGQPYCPNLAQLALTSVTYTNANTSRPSDSFPGLTALVSGGTPVSSGIYYDVAYDRFLAPPKNTTGNGVAGGHCTLGIANGTRTEFEEGIDRGQTKLNGGGTSDGGVDAIDPTRLPRDPSRGCSPVFPWNFVRTNTIFGVVHGAGGYAAWSDKHPAYSSVSGPGDGTNLDDFYAPEINSTVVPLPGVVTPTGVSCAIIRDKTQLGSWTDSFQNIQCYDTLKVNGIVNQINGLRHDGSAKAPVPNIFGMNFQAVSVGQKLVEANKGAGGYQDAKGTPSTELFGEFQYVDAALGKIVKTLRAQGLADSTLVVITAKHGQSPIDPSRYFPIPGPSGTNGKSPANVIAALLPYSESPLNPTGIGPTEDDVSVLWLSDSTQTDEAVSLLEANASGAGIGQIFSGPNYGPVDRPARSASGGRSPDAGHHRRPQRRRHLYGQ